MIRNIKIITKSKSKNSLFCQYCLKAKNEKTVRDASKNLEWFCYKCPYFVLSYQAFMSKLNN